MGYGRILMGVIMCVGSNSRSKRSLNYFFVFILTFAFISPAYANPALALLISSASASLRLFTVVVSKRVAQKAANDAVYTVLKKGTERGLTSALKSMSTRIGSGSIYNTSKNGLTWLGAGSLLTSDKMGVNYLNNSNIVVLTNAVDMGNGKYRIDYEGNTFYSDFMPSPENPFVIVKKTDNTTLADIVPIVLSNHQYYMINPVGDGFIVGSPFSVAYTYIKTLMDNKKLSCGSFSSKNCRYGSIAIDLHKPSVGSTSYHFNYSYTYFSTNNLDETVEVVINPVNGYIVNYNDQYIPSNLPNKDNNGYVVPSEDTGFIELEDLKNNPANLDALLALMNALMMEAASQIDYTGIPFDSSNPITKEELNQAIKENNITVSDFDLVYPISNPKNGFRFPNYPNLNTGSNSSTNSSSKEPDYSHPNPSLVEPLLEDIPTAEMILNPLKQFFPFLSDLNFGSHDVSCPVAKFDVFNTTVVLDSHCPLLEQNRSLFSLISLILWSFLAFRIVLTA